VTGAVPARDPGLQQERTALAWRRTGLALVIGALTVGRLTMDTLGASVLVPAVAAAVLAAWVVTVTLRGRRHAVAHPDEPGFDRLLRDGRVPAVVAVVAGTLAVGELTAALVQLLRP
jgi:uncharacterized membrane protein YidH (DUF202 family)